jgi:6-phosphogluconolactonase (cycloisomerase 2 family)
MLFALHFIRTVSDRIPPLIALVAFASLSGCGSNAVPPSSGPSPLPGPLAVVADRTAGTLLTLEINPQTGVPKVVSSLAVSGSYSLAADPQGRFVYLYDGGYVRSYGIDKASGRLAEVSAQPAISPWKVITGLVASNRHLYGRMTVGSAGSRIYLTRYSVDAAGALGPCAPASEASFDPDGCWQPIPFRFDPGFILPSADDRFIYANDSRTNTLPIAAQQPDGSFLDVASVPLPTSISSSLDAAAGPGFLAITGEGGTLQTFAIDVTTGLLTPRQTIEGAMAAVPYLPIVTVSSDGVIALLGASETSSTVQTWRVDAQGILGRRAEISLPVPKLYLAFDPTGRYLYVSGADGLSVFAVGTDGGLQRVGAYPSGTGPIVIVARCQVCPVAFTP